jgi:GNAT superfamily N-acetyltransferase
MDDFTVVELAAHETYPLRLSVLRFDTPSTDVSFAEDARPQTFHLGVRQVGAAGEVGDLVGISTWFPRPYGDEPAVQLRGMATAAPVRGRGVGGILVEAGCERALTIAPLVWARARDTALDFYVRHRFGVEGVGFVDESTGKPHHLIVRRLV